MRPRIAISRAAWLLGASWLPASALGAGEAALPSVRAELVCRAEAAPGRVLCELQLGSESPGRVVWADALVVSSPEFARPLRSRVTPERFAEAAPGQRRLSLAFVAGTRGSGQVTVLARAVVCVGQGAAERCRASSQPVSAELRAGS